MQRDDAGSLLTDRVRHVTLMLIARRVLAALVLIFRVEAGVRPVARVGRAVAVVVPGNGRLCLIFSRLFVVL